MSYWVLMILVTLEIASVSLKTSVVLVIAGVADVTD